MGVIVRQVRLRHRQKSHRVGEPRLFAKFAALWSSRTSRHHALRARPLEILEPRIVLASDFVFEAINAPVGVSQFTLTSTASELRILNSTNGAVLESQLIQDNSGKILIAGSTADEVLTIDGNFQTSFEVDFDAGDGNDRLVGPSGNSTWIVSQPGGGLLKQHIHFEGVENVMGADGGDDTFEFQPMGSFTGTVGGGVGGSDKLVLDGGSYASIISTATSVDSGTIERNSDMITYSGFESIIDNATAAATVITLGDNDDTATLSENTAGQLVFCDDDASSRTFAGLTFNKPVVSLTIDLAQLDPLGTSDDGDDHVTIESVDMGLAGLTILAETVDVSAGAAIHSTGDIHLLAKKTGIKQITDAGPVVFVSKDAFLDVGAGATITGHDVVLRAEAADKSVTTLLGTSELPNELLIDPIINDIQGLSALPIKFVSKESDARVSVHPGVSVIATGNVKVESDAIADANGGGAADTATSIRFPLKAKSKYFSAGYVHTTGTATVEIMTGVNIDAAGSVAIHSDGTSTALLASETSRQLGDFPSDPTGIAFSLAITRADAISKTTVAAGATITAGKTANITAEGLKDSEAEAEVGIYNDGRAGLAFGFDFSSATINTDVNGTVTANMKPGSVVKLEFDPTVTDPSSIGFVDADADADTIRVGEHALTTGDKVTYSNRRGTSIAGPLPGGVDGLTDGDVVFVIMTSGTDFSLLGSTFELRQAVRYNAEDGTPIGGLVDGKRTTSSPAPINSICRTTSVSFKSRSFNWRKLKMKHAPELRSTWMPPLPRERTNSRHCTFSTPV